jgi:alpha-L-fucosidase 2
MGEPRKCNNPTCMRLLLILLLALPAAAQTTAWREGHFHLDPHSVVNRSDLILSKPNLTPFESLPLGNGNLGVSLWAANGLTAQLNRSDTLPHRDSPGQLVIPSLTGLTSAKDFHARLDLYHATLTEQGGGITLTAWVQSATDTLIIDVTGAPPDTQQTAQLTLWPPRRPNVTVTGTIGTLAEKWIDNYGPGATNLPFGSIAAITAHGRNVALTAQERSITVTCKPDEKGHFQIIVASPNYAAPTKIALANTTPQAHEQWWKNFWQQAGLIKVSNDPAGEYLENLRTLYLYAAAAERGSKYPGSQAGIGDMFSAVQDLHHWDPAAYWHWNLRMQVAANIAAGLPQLNQPYFRLYRDNLSSIEDWTKHHMNGREGICVPETMRFNGPGIEYEPQWDSTKPPTLGFNCDAGSKPYYNARTISTGAEISLWIWRQYLATGDGAFLTANYPVMAASARFLLAYIDTPSNAHEQEWDVPNPTTDLSARMALYPAVIEAATLLHRDSALIAKLKKAIPQIPPLPQKEIIGASYDPKAPQHNEENIGLEPIWPYELIKDTQVAKATYQARPYPVHQDWSFDPVQAARLRMPEEVRTTLIDLTQHYQTYINGFANWGGAPGEFYVEQEGVVALALAEALVQEDPDGQISIAPAVPAEWDMEGTVWTRHQTRIHVQTHAGRPTTVAIEAGAAANLSILNPWPNQSVTVMDAEGKTLKQSANPVLTLETQKGKSYLLKPAGQNPLTFEPIAGIPASHGRKLGNVQLGN